MQYIMFCLHSPYRSVYLMILLVTFVADNEVSAFHSYFLWHYSVCEPLSLPKLSSTILSHAVPPHEGQESLWAVVKLLCYVY